MTRALFLMPPFSVHAARRDWVEIERFYNPGGMFECVVLVSLDGPSSDVPREVGSLRVVPVTGRRARPSLIGLGRRLYGRYDQLGPTIRDLAAEHRVDLLVQRYGGPIRHGVPVVWAAERLGLPSIVTFQADYQAQLRLVFGRAKALWRRVVDKRVWDYVIDGATAVWCVSEYLRADLMRRRRPPRRTFVIPNKDTIARFQDVPSPKACDELLTEVGLADWAVQAPLLAVGRFIPQKNYGRILLGMARLIERHPQARLIIVGQGPLEAEVRNQVQRLRLTDNVRIVSKYLSSSELLVLYQLASALVFCSLFEGQGRVVYEAMAAGTPVVGSNLGPIPEMIDDGKTGFLVDPYSSAAMAQAMERALDRPKTSMRHACLRAASTYDLDAINPREVALYRSLLGL
jgi:glycosyltransferase involved in cell wall biosynthesis